jgi:hypothetical protein
MRIFVPTPEIIAYWSRCSRARAYSAPDDLGINPVRLGAAGNAAALFLGMNETAHFVCDGQLFSAEVEVEEVEPDPENDDLEDGDSAEFEEWLVIKHVGPAPSYEATDLNAGAHEVPWFEGEEMVEMAGMGM